MSLKSLILVLIQYLSFLVIFLTGPVIAEQPVFLLIEIFGFFFGLWGVYEMRTSVLKISPEVSKKSSLITTGPYSYVRHPMYLAVLLVTLSLVLNHSTSLRILILIVLSINLIIKTDYEEKLLSKHFKEYEAYKKKVPFKLIPLIY